MFRLLVGDKQQNVKFMNHNSMNGRQWRCPPCPDLTAFHMRSTIYGTHNLSREGRGGEGRCRRDLAPCHVSLEKAVAVVDGLHHARQTKIPQALGARDFAHVCKCRSPPCRARLLLTHSCPHPRQTFLCVCGWWVGEKQPHLPSSTPIPHTTFNIFVLSAQQYLADILYINFLPC